MAAAGDNLACGGRNSEAGLERANETFGECVAKMCHLKWSMCPPEAPAPARTLITSRVMM